MLEVCPVCLNDLTTPGGYNQTMGVYHAARTPQTTFCCPECLTEFDQSTNLPVASAHGKPQ